MWAINLVLISIYMLGVHAYQNPWWWSYLLYGTMATALYNLYRLRYSDPGYLPLDEVCACGGCSQVDGMDPGENVLS